MYIKSGAYLAARNEIYVLKAARSLFFFSVSADSGVME